MALRGLVGEITFPGATDTLAFKTYVTQVLVPNLWPGACVVMDNLPAHKVTGIREAIEGVGATIIYLSPYSPDFSPIENCWSKVKEFLRTLFGANLCTVRPSNHRCSCCGHFPRYYLLVHPLLLLCFTQLRTAVDQLHSNLDLLKIPVRIFELLVVPSQILSTITKIRSQQ